MQTDSQASEKTQDATWLLLIKLATHLKAVVVSIGKYSEDYISGAAAESANQCNFSGEEVAKCTQNFKTVYLLAYNDSAFRTLLCT